ncbi:MAG: flagellar basal-body MS-ring/collar protein FliF [Vampirovibrionales bacterium]|nr:flagellar basal-body MS-ring/collar protein FliF [Vampirovibrionales bacterium]
MPTEMIQQNINRAGSNAGALWQRLSFGQKLAVGTLSLAAVFATGFFVFEAQNNYDVLYSNMSVADAAATVAKLKESNVPYRLTDGGTTILVPASKKNELVLDTASELSSEQPINLSKIPPVLPGEVQREWIRKVNTESIEEILESIQGIRQAKVIVTTPQETVFQDSEQPPSASVMIVAEAGFRLRLEHTKTIKNLVAHAVPGLKPEQVVIADNMGRSLEGLSQESSPDGLTESDVRRVRFETEMKKKIEALLTPIVGHNNAVVAVSAKLNFDQTQARIKRIIPQGGTTDAPTGVMVSQQSHIEEYNGAKKDAQSQQAAGVQSNASPSYQSPKGDGSGEDKNGLYKSSDQTTSYAHSEEEKSIVYAPGTLERLSVSVVLNKVLTKTESEEIKQAVANAAGIDAARGDSIDVKGFQFSESPETSQKQAEKAVREAEQQAFWIQMAYFAAVIILGLAALLVLYKLLQKPLEGQLMGRMDVESEPGQYGGYAANEAYEALTQSIDPETGQPILISQADNPRYALSNVRAVEAQLEPEVEIMRQSIHQLIKEEPQEAVRVIKTFLRDM